MGRPHLPKDREEMENGTAGATMDSDDLIFAPAEHTDSLKRRKERKKRERHGQDKTPRTKNTSKGTTSPKSPVVVESRQGTPPTARPPKAKEIFENAEDEDVWYAKWWMFCFPDAVRSMTPKR